MAFMLLQKNYNGIAHELSEFEKFGFTRLPVHIEEAALALAVSNKGRLPDTGNLQISKNTGLKVDSVSRSTSTIWKRFEISRTRIKKAVRGYFLVLCFLQMIRHINMNDFGVKYSPHY
jgi:hypothetical protein